MSRKRKGPIHRIGPFFLSPEDGSFQLPRRSLQGPMFPSDTSPESSSSVDRGEGSKNFPEPHALFIGVHRWSRHFERRLREEDGKNSWRRASMGVLLALLPFLSVEEISGLWAGPRPARAGTIVQNVDISYSYPMAGYGPGVYLEVYGFDFIDVPFPRRSPSPFRWPPCRRLASALSWEPDPGLSGCPLSQMRPSRSPLLPPRVSRGSGAEGY